MNKLFLSLAVIFFGFFTGGALALLKFVHLDFLNHVVQIVKLI